MKTWKIPVTWGMAAELSIEAYTLEEAIAIASGDNPLPEGDYVEDSFSLFVDDPDCIRESYNNNQEDEIAPLKKFNVFMDSYYVRDAQMLHTEDMSDDEMQEAIDKGDSDCYMWGDMEPVPYIGTVDAISEEKACEIVGKTKRYDPRVLYAEEIADKENDSDSRLKDLLINLINDEMEGRCETGEFVQDLLGMGFTAEDFSNLGFDYFNDLIDEE